MKTIIFFLILCVGLPAWAQISYVPPTRVLVQKGYQFGVSADYWNSTKRVDDERNKIDFQDGEKFTRLQSEVAGYYGLTNQLQVGGGALFRQNASTVNDETDTATGLQSTFATLKYAFRPVDRLYYAIEGLVRYMPYSNEERTTTNTDPQLALGDQGVEYSGGIAVTYASRTNNFLSGRVGLRQPGSDLSSEIYWQVEGAVTWKKFALLAGVDGVSSMKNDPHEDNLAEKPQYNNGTTFLYNGLNREWIAPYAGANFTLGNNWRVELKGSQVVSGVSTDLGTSFGISLIRRVDDAKKGVKADAKFKEYDVEATISKVSPKQGFVVIDKGLADDVRKGMKIDFFEFDYVGGNILIARGSVIQTKADTAIVKIIQTYNSRRPLKEGVVARGSFR